MIKRQAHGLRIIPDELRSLTMMELFRKGYDTADIAVAKGVSEARVYNVLAIQRGDIHVSASSSQG